MAYLYRHIRLDKNEPFYIGISSDLGYRAKDSKKRNKIWKDIVDKTKYDIEIILDDLTWEEACMKEIEFIKLYGRICNKTGCLANLSEGGEGYLNPSDEIRERLSISKVGINNPMYGKKLSDEHKSKISNSNKGRIFTEETKSKISKSQKGKKRNSEEFKQYLSKINKGENHPQFGKARSEETKEKISNALRGVKLSDEHKKKLSEKKSKKIINILENKIFNSIKDASIFYNIPYATLNKWVKKEKNNFKLI